MANFTPKLIPRKTFNARRYSQVLDSYNLPTNPGPSSFTVDNAGLQPSTGDKSEATQDGYKDKRIYTLYTTTEIHGPEEGTSNKGDMIEIEPGVWARVMTVDRWTYGVQSHYQAKLVVENER